MYGGRLGGVFVGGSRCSGASGASKGGLVHLVGRRIVGGYTLLDTQFVTEHLKSFGAVEIDRELYHHRLAAGLQTPADFYSAPASVAGSEVLQSITQTS